MKMKKQIKKRIALFVIFSLLLTTNSFNNVVSATTNVTADAETTVEAAVTDAPAATPVPTATEEPVPTGIPNYSAEPQTTGTDNDFRVGITYVSEDWKEQHFTDFSTNKVMQITGTGNYSISYTIGSDYDMSMLWLDTNLYADSKMEVTVTGVTVKSTDGTVSESYTLANQGLKEPGSLWGYRDSDTSENYAATVLNPYLKYMYYTRDPFDNYNPKYTKYGFKFTDTINLLNADAVKMHAGGILTVDFSVDPKEDSVPEETATPTPTGTKKPVVHGTPNYHASVQSKGTDSDFRVGVTYVSENWDETNFTDFSTEDTMQITGVGNYTASYTTAANDDIQMLWLDTNLYQGSKLKVDVTGVTFTSADGSTQYEYSQSNNGLYTPGSLWGYRDVDPTENYAATVLNPYIRYIDFVEPQYDNYRSEYAACGFDSYDLINLFNRTPFTLGVGTKITVSFSVIVDPIKETAVPAESPDPGIEPTAVPAESPEPGIEPTTVPAEPAEPSIVPTAVPIQSPTVSLDPTAIPAESPEPGIEPTTVPAEPAEPSIVPTTVPAESPEPDIEPTAVPTEPAQPATGPTVRPTSAPIAEPDPSASPDIITTPSASPDITPTQTPGNTPRVVPTPTTPGNTPPPSNSQNNTSGQTDTTVTATPYPNLQPSTMVKYLVNKDNNTASYKQTDNNKTTKLVIPATVEIDNTTYKVTSIAANAFADNKNLKNVTLGAQITAIGKNAFKNCKGLKTIVIRSTKLTSSSIAPNAFKGTSKNLVIKVPKKQYKKYKKFLKKKGNKNIRITTI